MKMQHLCHFLTHLLQYGDDKKINCGKWFADKKRNLTFAKG